MKILLTHATNLLNDIKMQFGIDKCHTMKMKRGVQKTVDETVKAGKEELTIEALQGEEMYKYLGMEQTRTTEKEIIKQRLSNEFQSRLHKICRPELNSGHLMKAINI